MNGSYVQGTMVGTGNAAMDGSFFEWFVVCRCPEGVPKSVLVKGNGRYGCQ